MKAASKVDKYLHFLKTHHEVNSVMISSIYTNPRPSHIGFFHLGSFFIRVVYKKAFDLFIHFIFQIKFEASTFFSSTMRRSHE